MDERKAMGMAGLTSLTWGLTGVFVRLLPPIPPLTITAGRLAIALATALPLLFVFRDTRGVFKSALVRASSYVLALLLAGYYLLATAAFQLATVAEVALFLSTPPLFVLAFRRLRGEPSSRAELSGALLAVGGIAVILSPRLSLAAGVSLGHLLGDCLAICAAALAAGYAFSFRMLAEKGRAPDSGGVSVLTFALGSAVLGTVAMLLPVPSGLSGLGSRELLLFLCLGLVSTAVPSLGFAVASKRLPALVTSTISLFIPLFSGVFAFWNLGEGLSVSFLLGSVLVLLGVALIIGIGRVRQKEHGRHP